MIVGHAGGRGVVTTACYIARRYGVRSAMPMFQALELCPEAVVVPPEMAKYWSVSRQIRAMLEIATPVIEPVSLDEAYLDVLPTSAWSDRPPAVLLAAIALEVERRSGSRSRSASASTSSWPNSRPISTSRAASR